MYSLSTVSDRSLLSEFEELCKYEQVKESKRLVMCFLNYLRHDKAEVNVLFEMLSIFLVQTRIDYTFLKEFYMVEASCSGTSGDASGLIVQSVSIMM